LSSEEICQSAKLELLQLVDNSHNYTTLKL